MQLCTASTSISNSARNDLSQIASLDWCTMFDWVNLSWYRVRQICLEASSRLWNAGANNPEKLSRQVVVCHTQVRRSYYVYPVIKTRIILGSHKLKLQKKFFEFTVPAVRQLIQSVDRSLQFAHFVVFVGYHKAIWMSHVNVFFLIPPRRNTDFTSSLIIPNSKAATIRSTRRIEWCFPVEE